ncbi:MAG: hypothetical protein IJ661_05990 [Lachnospiraceae bacterium]|nr:hypothetical protein [Lachnospiraceae bacterium]
MQREENISENNIKLIEGYRNALSSMPDSLMEAKECVKRKYAGLGKNSDIQALNMPDAIGNSEMQALSMPDNARNFGSQNLDRYGGAKAPTAADSTKAGRTEVDDNAPFYEVLYRLKLSADIESCKKAATMLRDYLTEKPGCVMGETMLEVIGEQLED